MKRLSAENHGLAPRELCPVVKKLIRKLVPHRETVRKSRLPPWIARYLGHPRLWHINCRGVAAGLAIGVFMGLLIPLAQIPLSMVLAIIARANVPVAIAATLVTNPFTFAPLYYLAYRIGAALIGADDTAVTQASLESPSPGIGEWLALWFEKIMGLGKPLVAGLLILATSIATFAYFGVRLAWRGHVLLRWRRRQRRRNRSGRGSARKRLKPQRVPVRGAAGWWHDLSAR